MIIFQHYSFLLRGMKLRMLLQNWFQTILTSFFLTLNFENSVLDKWFEKVIIYCIKKWFKGYYVLLSSELVVYKYCFECQNKKTIFVHNIFWTCIFLEQSLVILWVNWYKNKGFWKKKICLYKAKETCLICYDVGQFESIWTYFSTLIFDKSRTKKL